MHLRHVEIEHFKGIRSFSASFLREDGSLRPLTMLLGGNGSGKTTVLQAIAFVLALATRKIDGPGAFRWPGFLLERIGSGGHTRVKLEIGFEATEREATMDLHQRWKRSLLSPEALRSVPDAIFDSPQITLEFRDGELHCAEGPEGLALCLGRFFIRTILRTHPELRRKFSDVGDVFWFDQSRNLSSVDTDPRGIEGLRQYLIGWYAGHHTHVRGPDRPDFLRDLEESFARIFPGTRFVGVEPRPGLTAASPADSYFLIQRDGAIFDLAEMSSGEQAVFPLLFDFVRLAIARSLVLIDELELHLHPPQQQGLLASLRKIGPQCQFVMTTHSPYLESVMPDDEEIRLEGALRCL